MIQNALYNDNYYDISMFFATGFENIVTPRLEKQSQYWNISRLYDNIINIDNNFINTYFNIITKNYYHDKLSEIDNMDYEDTIIIRDFKYKNKIYLLNRSISLEKVYNSKLNSAYYIYKLLNIYIKEDKIENVLEDFYDQFSFLYRFYTKKKDKKLTEDARRLKQQLLELVKEVKRGNL